MASTNYKFRVPKLLITDKLRRGYSMKNFYETTCFFDNTSKLGYGVYNYIFNNSQVGKLELKIDSEFKLVDCLLCLNIFNIFINFNYKSGLFVFKSNKFSIVNTGNKLLRLLNLKIKKNYSKFNFLYFLLFFYLPRVTSLGSSITQPFSSSAVFPDFSLYSDYFIKFTKAYPHYSNILRKSGLLFFLDDFRIRFNLSLSSYILKNMYVSLGHNEDWNIKFLSYFSYSDAEFFRLQKSFFKFFVLGKNLVL